MQAIQDQQEIMGAIADMTIETYAMESAVLRAQKIVDGKGEVRRGLAGRHDSRLSVAGDGEGRIRCAKSDRRRCRWRHDAHPACNSAPARKV